MARRSLLLVLVLASACCAPVKPSPYRAVGEVSDAEVVSILRQRTPPLGSIYAVLTMTYDGPDRSGTFDVVMNYLAPESFRFTAFEDLVLAAHDIFDLVMLGQRYAVRYEQDDDDEPQLHEGELGALAKEHPRFSGFAWAREAMFLPGNLPAEPEPEVVRDGGSIEVRSVLSSGVPVRWKLDPETLAVDGAELTPTGEQPVRMVYADYEQRGSRILATTVRFEDPARGVVIAGELDELELEPELSADDFALD